MGLSGFVSKNDMAKESNWVGVKHIDEITRAP